MSRDYNFYFEDILEASGKIECYVKDVSLDQFSQDEMRIDGFLRNLEVIGEATKNLPPELREEYADIDWRKIAGLRDVLVHAYFSVNLMIIWDIVQNKVPELHQYVSAILKRDDDSTFEH